MDQITAVLLTISYVIIYLVRDNPVEKINQKHTERFLVFALAQRSGDIKRLHTVRREKTLKKVKENNAQNI